MSSEYSISVNDWTYDDWEFTGRDVMYNYYEANPKEAEKEGYDLDEEDNHVKYLDELADNQNPMMLYAYPLNGCPDTEKIIELCRKTNCTVMMKKDTEEYFLALCGGGMDLSQDIALAYMIAQNWIPSALAYNVCTQPNLSVHGKDWLDVANRCKKELKFDIDNARVKIKEWNEAIKEFKQVKK